MAMFYLPEGNLGGFSMFQHCFPKEPAKDVQSPIIPVKEVRNKNFDTSKRSSMPLLPIDVMEISYLTSYWRNDTI